MWEVDRLGERVFDDVLDYISKGDVSTAIVKLVDLVRDVVRGSEDMPGVLADMVVTGASMIIDDIKDVGKFDRIHHWMYGVVLFIVGMVMLVILMLGVLI